MENSGFGSARVFQPAESGEVETIDWSGGYIKVSNGGVVESELPNPPDYKKWLEDLSDD